MHCPHRALFMALCRARSRRNAIDHSVNLMIFVTVELSLCVQWHARHLADHAVLHFDKSARWGVAVQSTKF